jgi:hypothetical protein
LVCLRQFVLLALSVWTNVAWSEVATALSIAEIAGDGWRIDGLAVKLHSAAPQQMSVQLRMQQVQLPDRQDTIRELVLSCPLSRQATGYWHCEEGGLAVADAPIDAQQTTWSGRFASASEWAIDIPGLNLAGGSASFAVAYSASRWTADVTVRDVRIDRLSDMLPAPHRLPDWDSRGRVRATLRGSGSGTTVTGIDASLRISGLDFASPDGRHAAEKLNFSASGRGASRDGRWRVSADAEVASGAFYSEPLFIDAAASRVSLSVRGAWSAPDGIVDLDGWQVDAADTLSLAGTGRIATRPAQIEDLTVVARSDSVARLYERILQPFLIGTPADDLEVEGRLGMVLHLDAEGFEQAGLELNELVLDDRQGHFSLGATSGSVAWDRDRQVPVSRVTVRDAGVYGIPIGSFDLLLQFAGDRVTLVEPLVVPLLEGAFAVDSFALQGALMAGDAPRWSASASLRDISLEALTRALELPPFDGSLQGQLTDLRYAGQVLEVGGELSLAAFGGNIAVDGLSIGEPLGVLPRLCASARLRGLDLESLTRTFSFGRIEGRLDGDLDNLSLVGWSPDRFDLHLYTPPGDRSRRRISQRAVENLTELGSGVPAGLSTTFLRMFEEFGYDRIDVRLALDGDVAQLDGLAREEGGYYLVRGSGLPRIDVIGRNRSVAWRELIERLRQIQVQGARIE